MGYSHVEIKHNQVVVKKENRREEVLKQFTSNYFDTNESLKSGFGAAKSFVQRSKDEKEGDTGNINYNYIQEFYCSQLTKVDYLYHHCWPLSEIGPSKFYLWKYFLEIPFHIVLEHQAETNIYCSKTRSAN